MNLRAVDIETTGFEPPAYPIEFGWCDVQIAENGRAEAAVPDSFLFDPKPGEKIPPAAMAIHHITNEMMVGAIGRDAAIARLTELLTGADILVAHQARFEKQWLAGLTERPWVCTWKVACTRFPDLVSHGLQELRYEFALDSFLPDYRNSEGLSPSLMPPHRAGPDAAACALLVGYFLKVGISVEDMLAISAKPCLLPRVTFGKHYGEKWHDIPSSYMDWVMKNMKDDEDVVYTARYWHNIKTYKKQAGGS